MAGVPLDPAVKAEAHLADLEIEADEDVHFEQAWLDPESGAVASLHYLDLLGDLLLRAPDITGITDGSADAEA